MAKKGGYTVLKLNESDSKVGVFHEIRRGADGVIYCSCISWRFKKRCWHLDSFNSSRAPV